MAVMALPISKKVIYFLISWGCIVFFAPFLMAQTAPSPSQEMAHYIGKAYDKKTNKFIYTEEYKESLTSDQELQAQVVYRDPTGKIFATKDVKFGNNWFAPEYRLEDQRDGYTEGVERSGDKFNPYLRVTSKDELKKKELDVPSPVVTDAGFHYFILKNWDVLMEGETLDLHMIVPFQLDYFKFTLKKIEEHREEGHPLVLFQIKIDSFLLSTIISPITVTYDVNSKQILKFDGIGIVNDEKGKSWIIKMNYQHQK